MKQVTRIIALLMFLPFQSCDKNDDSSNIINDVFLSVVDTIAYKYHTLRPAPQDPVFPPSTEKINITVYEKLNDIHEWHRDILLDLNEQTFQNAEDYKRMYQSSLNDTIATKLDVLTLKNIGRYHLVPNNNYKLPTREGFAGHVKFSKVIHANGFGLLVATLKDNIKNDIVRLFYLKKENGTWKVVRETDLQVS